MRYHYRKPIRWTDIRDYLTPEDGFPGTQELIGHQELHQDYPEKT